MAITNTTKSKIVITILQNKSVNSPDKNLETGIYIFHD